MPSLRPPVSPCVWVRLECRKGDFHGMLLHGKRCILICKFGTWVYVRKDYEISVVKYDRTYRLLSWGLGIYGYVSPWRIGAVIIGVLFGWGKEMRKKDLVRYSFRNRRISPEVQYVSEWKKGLWIIYSILPYVFPPVGVSPWPICRSVIGAMHHCHTHVVDEVIQSSYNGFNIQVLTCRGKKSQCSSNVLVDVATCYIDVESSSR